MVVGATVVGVTVTAEPVAAAPVRGAAFVLADQPLAPKGCYTPNPDHSMNTSDVWDTTGRLNEVCRLSQGLYTVRFRNLKPLGAAYGAFHVTAVTNGPALPTQCMESASRSEGTDAIYQVFCYSLTGAPVDSMFSTSWTNINTPPAQLSFLPDATFGWLMTYTGISDFHCLTPTGEFHSRGGWARICRTDAVGYYTVTIAGLDWSEVGHVQVSANGWGVGRVYPFSCKAGPRVAGPTLEVYCFDATGAPAVGDPPFWLSYATDGNILGVELCCHPNGHDSAYAWADLPTVASYDLGSLFQFNRLPHYRATAERLGRGRYTTRYESDPDLDHGVAMVTAYGSGSEFCNLARWNRIDGIRVNCFDRKGTLVDSDYGVAFTGRWTLG